MALSLPTRITLHFCTTFATLLLHFRPGALRMTVRSCRQKKPLVLPHDYPFVPPSFSALRRRVRLRSAGEPDIRVRTFSTRYLTANSHWPHTSRPIWPLLATVFRLRCQALAEHAAPDARIRAPTPGRLRLAFLTSLLVHRVVDKGP